MAVGLCERCRKAQATFHMTNIDPDGEKSERHLCEKCAIEEGLIQIQKPVMNNEVLEQFITASKAAGGLGATICEECGISFVEFKNQGPLGCPHDYDAFKPALHAMIERAHDGASEHVGKVPRSAREARPNTQQELSRLRRQLDDAVTAEDYKQAATLRDRLRELEAQ